MKSCSGWRKESKRHKLASQGIKTGRKVKQFITLVPKTEDELREELFTIFEDQEIRRTKEDEGSEQIRAIIDSFIKSKIKSKEDATLFSIFVEDNKADVEEALFAAKTSEELETVLKSLFHLSKEFEKPIELDFSTPRVARFINGLISWNEMTFDERKDYLSCIDSDTKNRETYASQSFEVLPEKIKRQVKNLGNNVR